VLNGIINDTEVSLFLNDNGSQVSHILTIKYIQAT